jgi:hypothetical protein
MTLFLTRGCGHCSMRLAFGRESYLMTSALSTPFMDRLCSVALSCSSSNPHQVFLDLRHFLAIQQSEQISEPRETY